MKKAFLILEDGTVFQGTSIGSQREVISEIVFNTSMTGYLEVLTDPSYAGQAVTMTYPLIGNYGICRDDMESERPWPDGFIVRELSVSPVISALLKRYRTFCPSTIFRESPESIRGLSRKFSGKREP